MMPLTALYCWTWLSGPDWPKRVRKYLDYYRGIQQVLGFDKFHLADNASAQMFLDAIKASDVEIHRFDKELHLGGRTNEYPYVWRGFYFLKELMKRYEKIIICDSDSFILSHRMADFIKKTNTGFYTFWTDHGGTPCSEISILNQDSFESLLKWMEEVPWEERSNSGVKFETSVPYTNIYRQFIGDRYGFTSDPPSHLEIDYYTQAKNEKVMIFEETERWLTNL